jgi:hypothetical protein
MEIRHNTKLLEEAIALVVRRAEIPMREAESLAAERLARAAARRRLATGAAIALAAVGVGVALWLAMHPYDRGQVVIREPYPTPGPTVTVTSEPKIVAVPGPTVTVTSAPSPTAFPTTSAQPTVPSDPHTPVVNYTKFASQTVSLFGRQWEIQAGHQFANETQKDWDAAWCYLNADVGGIIARVDLANRLTPEFAPVGPLASSDTFRRVGLSDDQAAELAAHCPWLDGRAFSVRDLSPPAGRVPNAVSPAIDPGTPTATPGVSTPLFPNTDSPTPTTRPFSVNDGYDALGNDLPGMPLDSANVDECQKDCEENLSCNAFTYNKKYDKCFLKDKSRIIVQSVQAISGYKVDLSGVDYAPITSQLKIHSKRAVTGRPYRSFPASSFDVCLVTCEKDRNYCMGVNFDTSITECSLFGNVTGVIIAPTMQAGERLSNH